MLTIVLSAAPDHELFSQGLDCALNAADGSEPCQVIITPPLLEALRTLPEDSPTVKQLHQLDLFAIPTSCALKPCALLAFATVLSAAQWAQQLRDSRHVLVF